MLETDYLEIDYNTMIKYTIQINGYLFTTHEFNRRKNSSWFTKCGQVNEELLFLVNDSFEQSSSCLHVLVNKKRKVNLLH